MSSVKATVSASTGSIHMCAHNGAYDKMFEFSCFDLHRKPRYQQSGSCGGKENIFEAFSGFSHIYTWKEQDNVALRAADSIM